MPYDWEGNWIPSKADNSSDIIGFGDVGGIGQLIYHTFRFGEYVYETAPDGVQCLKPVGKAAIDKTDGLSGADIFSALYNLGKHINDSSVEKPFDEHIIDFCKKVAQPYFIDSLYDFMMEPSFDYSDDGDMLERDAMFSVSDFMRDLGSFYNTAQFYFALKEICNGDGDTAFNLAKEGKFFEGLPFFEKYKHGELVRETETKASKVPISKGDLLSEMQSEKAKQCIEQHDDAAWFAVEPYDDFDNLWATLIDIIPDFHMRLKVNPRNKQVVFAADVHSVFDIAWYTLARLIADFGAPEEGGRVRDLSDGTLVVCLHCGEAFIRRNNRQQYCLKPECQKAHNALRQRRFRESKKLKDTQNRSK